MHRTIVLLSAGLIAFAAGSASAQNASPHNLILFVPDGLRGRIVTPQTAPAMAEVRDNGVNFENSHSLFPTSPWRTARRWPAVLTGDSLNTITPGINGPTSMAGIRSADNNLAQLRKALDELGLAASTNIIVSSDHGFSTISKESKTSHAAKISYEDTPKDFLRGNSRRRMQGGKRSVPTDENDALR